MNPVLIAVLGMLSLFTAGFLAAAEAAFLYLPRKEAEQLVTKRPNGPLVKVLKNPKDHTDAIRLWRVWVEFLSAILATALMIQLFERSWLALLVVILLMGGVSALLIALSPRELGRRYDNQLVQISARLVHILRLLVGPLPSWLRKLADKMSPEERDEQNVFFADEHFMEFVTRASEADVIEDSEAELIQSVVDLSDTKVRAVMVPRTDMITINEGTTLKKAMSLFLRSGNSRIPVIGEDADNILGVIYLKDVAAELFQNEEGSEPKTLKSIQREITFVPESKPVSEVLDLMQRENIHLAIVVDEYGGTAGLVTLEDLIEEIVGEITDEYDKEQSEVEYLENNVARISTSMSIDDFAEMFDLDLTDYEDVDTLGGLFAAELGQVPIVGNVVEIENLHLMAEKIQGRRNRISHVLVTIQPKQEGRQVEQEVAHDQ